MSLSRTSSLRNQDTEPYRYSRVFSILSHEPSTEPVTRKTSQKEAPRKGYQDLIEIKVKTPSFGNLGESTYSFKIHKERDTTDIYNKVQKFIEDSADCDLSQIQIILTYRNAFLRRDITLKEAGIAQDIEIQALRLCHLSNLCRTDQKDN